PVSLGGDLLRRRGARARPAGAARGGGLEVPLARLEGPPQSRRLPANWLSARAPSARVSARRSRERNGRLIEIESLRKQYGDLVAVDGVTPVAPAGGIFGLLGPNGAGKSTCIGCISGLLPPTAGRVRVLGHDVVSQPRSARESLGIVPQELALYEDLSAHE